MQSLEPFPNQFENNFKIDVAKTDLMRSTGLNPFRVSAFQQKPKQKENPTSFSNAVSSNMTPRPKLTLRRNCDIASPIHTENPQKSPVSLSKSPSSNKAPKITTIKLDDSSPEPKLSKNSMMSPRTRKIVASDIILVKSPSLKGSNSPHSPGQKSYVKIPISEFTRKTGIQEKSQNELSLKIFSSTERPEEEMDTDISKKGPLLLKLPSDEMEENTNESELKLKNKGVTLCTTMESSQVGKTKLSSFSHLSSTPLHKNKNTPNIYTFKEVAIHTTFSSPKGDSTKSFRRRIRFKSGDQNIPSGPGTGTAKSKNSKAVYRFTEAVEMAKVYDDQVILQYQFDKQNEEEEHDFFELCEMLQNNIKE